MTPLRSHVGEPGPPYSRLTRELVRHDSQELAITTGQNSHNRSCRSIIMHVLQSGKPGVSAMRNGSLQFCSPFFFLAPKTATSSELRSPEPRYQETSKSPLGHSTMPGAWLC